MGQEQGLELGTVKEQEESLEEATELGQEKEEYLGPDMDLEEDMKLDQKLLNTDKVLVGPVGPLEVELDEDSEGYQVATVLDQVAMDQVAMEPDQVALELDQVATGQKD
ncbi:hypothetical protein J4Q44_G00119670 [Coregonus suidteri]|uniref:Uncharacterized protein n=1 Tax=Coregonus suidteri TaxID=861788 RepID=A0AAN8R7K4_9TELE